MVYKDYVIHIPTCFNKSIACPFDCNTKLHYNSHPAGTEHYEVCQNATVECILCKQYLLRTELGEHTNTCL